LPKAVNRRDGDDGDHDAVMTTGAHGMDAMRSTVSMTNETSAPACLARDALRRGAARGGPREEGRYLWKAPKVIERKDHRSMPSFSPFGGE